MRRPLTMIAVIALPVMLAACRTMTPEERRAADQATCRSYGFKLGTDAFATCMMNQDLDRRADARSFRDSQDDFFWGPGPVIVTGPGYYGHRHYW